MSLLSGRIVVQHVAVWILTSVSQDHGIFVCLGACPKFKTLEVLNSLIRRKKDPFPSIRWAKVSLLAGISEPAHGGLHPVRILRRFKRIIHVSCGGGPGGWHLLCDCHPRFHSRPSPLLTRISQYRWETFPWDHSFIHVHSLNLKLAESDSKK